MRGRKPAVFAAALALGTAVSGGVVTAAPASETPCAPSAKACVDLSSKQAWLQQGGHVTYGPVPITSGKPSAPTPTGVFQVQWKDADHRSGEFGGAPMPYSVFFTLNGIAFHQGSLTEQSNGCIHLSTSAAPRFFESLTPGEEVRVVA